MSKQMKILIAISVVFFLISMGLLAGLVYVIVENDSDTDSEESVQESNLVTDYEQIDESDMLQIDEYISELPSEDLSEQEIAGLLLMREEEKLAHDVYASLYKIWGQRIFTNISDSEQTHTDTVADVLAKYDIEDPVDSNAQIGEFENEVLASLYTDLVEKGENSLIDALEVGATVEDLDIKDLSDLMEETDNDDILAAYQNLQKGSRNHLRSFVRMLNRNGADYEPQYISEAEYAEIIGSASENGVMYDAEGEEI